MTVAVHAHLLSLLDAMRESGSWCGETHLQKCAYLLRQLEGVDDLPYEFVMYKHGPYSFDLHDAIGELEASYLIQREADPPYGSHLKLTSSGERYLQLIRTQVTTDLDAIRSIAREFSALTVAELERHASAAYVAAEDDNLSGEARVQRLLELKPHIPDSLAEQSFQRIAEYDQKGRGGSTTG